MSIIRIIFLWHEVVNASFHTLFVTSHVMLLWLIDNYTLKSLFICTLDICTLPVDELIITRCDITKVHCVPDWVWEMNFSRSPTGLTFTADWLLLVSFFWLVQTVGGTLLLFTFRLRTLIVPHVYMCVCEWYFPHFLRDMSVLQWKHS